MLFPIFLLPFLYILWTEKLPDVAAQPGRPPHGRRPARRQHGGGGLGRSSATTSLPFEVASVFLLVAMIGAVVLGKRSLEKMD